MFEIASEIRLFRFKAVCLLQCNGKGVCLPDWFSDGLICRLEVVPIKFFK